MRIFGLLIGFLLCFSCVDDTSETIKIVTAEEMQLLLKQDNVQLVDVRTLKEYKKGFIDEAQNIDFFAADFETKISKLDKTKPVFVYCQKGGRSAKCAKKMKALGFTKIYDLDGGYSKWYIENKN